MKIGIAAVSPKDTTTPTTDFYVEVDTAQEKWVDWTFAAFFLLPTIGTLGDISKLGSHGDDDDD